MKRQEDASELPGGAGERASPYSFQGLTIRAVKLEVMGSYRKRDLNRAVVLKVGQPLSMREVSRSIELLYRQGAIADVEAEAEAVPGGVEVRFRVWPASLVDDVVFRGNRQIGDQKLREQLTVRPGSVYAWADARKQADHLVRFYQGSGFLLAKVVPTTRRVGRGRMEILYKITEGQQVRIREVRFEGNDVFSPRQLHQVVGLEEGRPFRPSELEERRKTLVDHYRAERFLGARIKAFQETTPDQTGVILRFEIEEGARIRLEFYQVRVSASGPLDGLVLERLYRLMPWAYKEGQRRKVSWFRRRDLLLLLDLENEQQFTAGFSEEAADRIRSWLIQQGYTEPGVSAERVSSPDGREVTFRFVLDPGRRIRIQKVAFELPEGAFFDATLLGEVFQEAMLPYVPAGLYTIEALDQALPRIELYYRSQGFLEVRLTQKVAIHESSLGPRATLTLQVEEGPRTVVKSVQLVGNTVLPAEVLKPLVTLSPGEPYDPQQIRETSLAIRSAYATKGYIYTQVFASKEASPETPTEVNVRLEIDEGPQAQVGEIVVRGARRTRPRVITRELQFKPGDVYAPGKLEESRTRLSRTGLFSSILIYPIEGERIRDLMVEVQERKARTLALSGGIQLNAFELNLDSARFDASLELAHSNLWGVGHRIAGRFELESSYLPDVPERALGQAIFPDYALDLGRDLIDYLDNATSRRIVLEYQSPYLLGFKVKSIASITLFERDRQLTYLLHRNSAALSLSQDVGRVKTYLQGQATLRRPDLEETDPNVQLWDIDREQRLMLQGSLAFLIDQRDNPFNPTQGVLLRLQGELGLAFGCGVEWNSLEQCDTALAAQEGFLRFSGSASVLRRVVPWLRFEGRAQAGLLVPFGTDDGAVPMEKRFYLGGAGTVRGFTQNSLGPVRFREKTLPSEVVSGWTAVPTGGNALFSVTGEAQFPLSLLTDWFTDWDLAYFVDAGNVFWTGSSREVFESIAAADAVAGGVMDEVSATCESVSTFQGLRASTGFGFRYRTGIGPVRLDVGFPIRRKCPAVEKSWAVHFSIGLF